MIVSKLDNSTYETREEFHKHLRKLKVKQETYYATHEPRVCRHTGQPIQFKDYAQYSETDFIDKDAMQAWIRANREEAKVYLMDLISRRAKTKGMKFAPCDVELKSLGLPRAKFFESVKGYGETCTGLKLAKRFDYTVAPTPNHAKCDLTIDSREQLPLNVPGAITERLHYGDYALRVNPLVAVERKSISDFVGTLISGYDRFEREIARADEMGGYLVVLCETDIETALNFNEIPEIRAHTKVKPQIVFHNIRELIQRYQSVQFAFCRDRQHMGRTIRAVLNWGEAVRRYDLQHLIEEGVI